MGRSKCDVDETMGMLKRDEDYDNDEDVVEDEDFAENIIKTVRFRWVINLYKIFNWQLIRVFSVVGFDTFLAIQYYSD